MLAWNIILIIILYIAFMVKKNKMVKLILFDISIMGLSLLQIFKDTNSLLFSIMVTVVSNILIYILIRVACKSMKKNDCIKE